MNFDPNVLAQLQQMGGFPGMGGMGMPQGVDRSIPNLPPPPQVDMPSPAPMPQGANQQAGLLAQNQPMQTNQLMQMMQGLNSPYLQYMGGGGGPQMPEFTPGTGFSRG